MCQNNGYKNIPLVKKFIYIIKFYSTTCSYINKDLSRVYVHTKVQYNTTL